jgi:hypothetical protein
VFPESGPLKRASLRGAALQRPVALAGTPEVEGDGRNGGVIAVTASRRALTFPEDYIILAAGTAAANRDL